MGGLFPNGGQFLANLLGRNSGRGDPKRPNLPSGFTPAGFSGAGSGFRPANPVGGIGDFGGTSSTSHAGGNSRGSSAISGINQQFDVGAADARELFQGRLSTALDDLAGRGLANSSTRGGLQIDAASGLSREMARLRANQATATTNARNSDRDFRQQQQSSDRSFQLQILEMLRGLSNDTGAAASPGPRRSTQFR